MKFTLNHQAAAIPDGHADEPLLFVLRDSFALNGPRFGCGVGSCGACTVLVDDEAQRACVVSAGSVVGRRVLTLEGLAAPDGSLHPLQEAWIAESVPQCGYCQSGQILTAHALLNARPDADAGEIVAAMDGVLCRCGTQQRIRRAIARAQSVLAGAA